MGGMGIIYEGTQLSIDRRVAVKVLRPTLAEEVEYIKRFQREIELISKFFHPNIVTAIDAGRDAGGLHFLVTEYIDGKTVRELFDGGKLGLIDLTRLLQQVCDALWEAHTEDIIHRDLKMDNIMVKRRSDGQVQAKILDFGVARDFTDRSSLTKQGDVPGTPSIVAPELVEQARPSPRSDIYSLGIIIYEVLTGSTPFQEETDLELIRAHQQKPIPPIEEQVSENPPPELIQLTHSLLEKDPDDRPHDTLTVKRQLEKIETLLSHRSAAESTQLAEPKQKQPESDSSDRGPVIRAIFGDKPLVAPQNILMVLTALLGALALLMLLLVVQTVLGF